MGRVLVACEFSGTVRDAFIARGHDAMSCDLLPTEKPGPHYEGDVMDVLDGEWDLLIAHPPCTYLCNSGVRWLKDNPERQEQMYLAARFFAALLVAPIMRVCVENPIPHGYAIREISKYTAMTAIRYGQGPDFFDNDYSQIVQPWMFGHGETKATCLWLRNLPNLEPTNIVEGREGRIHKMPPGPDRWKKRSVTYQGIADAMAAQWGELI